MGQRANLILVENGSYRLFYDHWCANTMERDLFWGPQHAREFILAHKECEINDQNWLDEKWAEGGVVLDLDKQHLLLFFTSDLGFDLQLRHFYMELLCKVWKGWNVQYAQRGIAQLAEYVGFPLDNIITPIEKDTPYPIEKAFSHMPFDPGEFYVSIKHSDGSMDIHVSGHGIVEISEILYSPEFISKISPLTRYSDLPADSLIFLNKYTQILSGIHIDEPAKTIHYWTYEERFSCLEIIQRNWPGWTIHRLGDNYLEHSRLTVGKIQFPKKPRETLIREIGESLFLEYKPVDVLGIAKLISKNGENVELNPAAFIQAHWQMNPDRRLEIWKSLLAQENPPIDLESTLPK